MASYTKNDFKVTWFSGTGKGGQHRNKHQNCCRIIHIATGLMGTGQRSRERVKNQDDAFRTLAKKLIALDAIPGERRSCSEVVRTYHFERGEAIDHASGLRRPISHVIAGEIDEFVTHQNRQGKRQQSGRA